MASPAIDARLGEGRVVCRTPDFFGRMDGCVHTLGMYISERTHTYIAFYSSRGLGPAEVPDNGLASDRGSHIPLRHTPKRPPGQSLVGLCASSECEGMYQGRLIS
jgi:hypothetical protein